MTMQVYIWDVEFEFMTTLNYLQKCWQQKMETARNRDKINRKTKTTQSRVN